MNGPQGVNLKDPVPAARSRNRTGKKLVIAALAVFIVVVMITWLGFLGWGAVASLQWIFDFFKSILPV